MPRLRILFWPMSLSRESHLTSWHKWSLNYRTRHLCFLSALARVCPLPFPVRLHQKPTICHLSNMAHQVTKDSGVNEWSNLRYILYLLYFTCAKSDCARSQLCVILWYTVCRNELFMHCLSLRIYVSKIFYRLHKWWSRSQLTVSISSPLFINSLMQPVIYICKTNASNILDILISVSTWLEFESFQWFIELLREFHFTLGHSKVLQVNSTDV